MIKTLVKTRICNKCKAEKPLSEFYKNPRVKSGVKAICKECYKKEQNERRFKKQQPKNITPLWTISAIACLLRHCVCEKCLMEDLESHCRMKYEVIRLVKQYGTPIEYIEPTIIEEK